MLVESFYVKLACGSFNSSWFYAIISAGLNLLGVDSWLIQYLFMVCYCFFWDCLTLVKDCIQSWLMVCLR